MLRRRGFTLLELLLALAILVGIIAYAFSSTIQTLQIQSDQEAITSTQAKLRRVIEVLTQDIRSAVLGGIINQPYSSSNQAVSFALLEGGAGYPVLSTSNFAQSYSLNILAIAPNAASVGIASGDQVMLVNNSSGNGQAVLLTVTGVNGSNNQWTISHTGCRNTIGYTTNTLLFKVRSQGYSYDNTNKTLLSREGNAAAQTVAFQINGFNVDYIYQRTNTTQEFTNPPGYRGVSGTDPPAQQFPSGGQTYTLQRLQLTLTAGEASRGRTISRTYTSQIDLVDTRGIQVTGVVACTP